MVKSAKTTVDVPLGVYTTLFLYLSSYRVEPGETFLVFGQLADEFGVGIDGADIDIYVDGVFDVTVKTGVATTPEGEEVHGYYSKTYMFIEVDRYKFQTKFKGGTIAGVAYAPSESATAIIGVGVEPVEFYLLNVRAVDVKTGNDLEVSFVYDTLSRKTPYTAKLTEAATLTFTFPEADGIKFVEWEDGSTELTRAVTISADTELIAYYEVVPVVPWVGLIVMVIGLGALFIVVTRA